MPTRDRDIVSTNPPPPLLSIFFSISNSFYYFRQFCQSTDSIDAAQYTELPRSSDEDYYSREVCVNGNPNAELMR